MDALFFSIALYTLGVILTAYSIGRTIAGFIVGVLIIICQVYILTHL